MNILKSTILVIIFVFSWNTALVYSQSLSKWSEVTEVDFRRKLVVTYRAKLEGNYIIIEADHEKDWHTYSMDNKKRAAKKSGKQIPDTELQTTIELSGGLKIIGNWYQTVPEDLSQPEIRWYSWGFNGKVRFAAKVERTDGDNVTIRINGQSCNESLCKMIEDVVVTLPLPSVQKFGNSENFKIDLKDFVIVQK